MPTHVQKTFDCPHCGKEITIDSLGNVVQSFEQQQEKALATMKVNIAAPSSQEVAQARFDRDVKMGTPIVEKPAGVVMPQQNMSGNGAMLWLFCVITAMVLICVFSKRCWPLGRD